MSLSRPCKEQRTAVDNEPQAPVGNHGAINIDSSDDFEQKDSFAQQPNDTEHRHRRLRDPINNSTDNQTQQTRLYQ